MSILTTRERQEYAKKYRIALRQCKDREFAHAHVYPAFRAQLLMNAKLDPARGAGWWTNEVRKAILSEVADIEWSVKNEHININNDLLYYVRRINSGGRLPLRGV